jgi:hypothetical protein
LKRLAGIAKEKCKLLSEFSESVEIPLLLFYTLLEWSDLELSDEMRTAIREKQETYSDQGKFELITEESKTILHYHCNSDWEIQAPKRH